MSTSLLYHAFGLVGYHYRQPTVPGGSGDLPHRTTPRTPPLLRSAAATTSGSAATRNAPSAPCPSAASRPSLTLDVPRVWCFVCDSVRQVKIGFADPKKRYTRSFERYALELSRHMTIKDVAEHLQVSWDTIKDIQAKQPAAPLRQAQAAQAQADRHR